MTLVQTTHGLIDRDSLQPFDIVEETDNCRVTATEWYLDGELVRRDVNVNVLCGIDLTQEQEAI